MDSCYTELIQEFVDCIVMHNHGVAGVNQPNPFLPAVDLAARCCNVTVGRVV